MRQYRSKKPAVAEACLKSMGRHLDYLTTHLVIFALADDSVPVGERNNIARDIIKILRHDKYPLGVSKFPKSNFPFDGSVWKDDGSLPSLSRTLRYTSGRSFRALEISEILSRVLHQ